MDSTEPLFGVSAEVWLVDSCRAGELGISPALLLLLGLIQAWGAAEHLVFFLEGGLER